MAVNKVVQSNGTTLIDITPTTAVASDVASGKIFFLADGTQATGTGQSGGSSGQTATGTVTGTGTNVLEIPCSFAPDLIYVHGDLSGDVSNRGVVSFTIIKNEYIDVHSDASQSADSETLYYASHDITGYNESDTSNPHASYANGVLTLTSINSSSTRFTSGQTYTYELSTIGTGGGGSSATLVTKSITANGTYDAEDDNADGYSSVTVNVPSSAASSWTKVAETSYQVSTTGTTATTVATWETGHSELWTSDKIVYVRVRDTAGKRTGYFYGVDQFFFNYAKINHPGYTDVGEYLGTITNIWRCDSNGQYAARYGYNSTGYGVYADMFYDDGRIRIKQRYSSSYTLTINSTYKVEVYLLDPPTGAPIFT